MNSGSLSKLEQLCRDSVSAGVKTLCKTGVWPRPPAARRIRAGYDFPYNVFQNIKEVEDFVQHLASDHEIRAIYFGPSSTPDLWTLYDYWMTLLLRILSDTEGRFISKGVFRKWFTRFVRELYSDTAKWRAVDTITGLTVRGAQLRLDQSTVLTSIPGYDLRGILLGQERDYKDGPYRDGWEVGGLDKATIITTARIPKCQYPGLRDPPPHLFGHIDRSLAAIDALRLVKAGVPRLHCHAIAQLSSFPLADPLTYCDREAQLQVHEKETILEKADFHNVRQLWQYIMKVRSADHVHWRSPSSPISTALGRFFESYRHKYWMDSIVDLTISLESLFGPKDTQELSHRISLRGAWLLSSHKEVNRISGKATNRVYWSIRTMYKIRSSRVHGQTPNEGQLGRWVETLSGARYDRLKFGELVGVAVESARDVVRKAITACIALSKLGPEGPRWPLPRDFDENIVICDQRRAWQRAAGIIKSKG